MKPVRFLKVLLAGAAGAATGVVASMVRYRRPSPEESERRRRLDVNAHGRTGSATVLDFQEGVVTYVYEMGGTEYVATQDVSTLSAALPQNPEMLTGRPAIIKYLPRNPANSIVLCEAWSGLLFQPHASRPESAPEKK